MFRPHRAIIRLTKMVLTKVHILVARVGSHGYSGTNNFIYLIHFIIPFYPIIKLLRIYKNTNCNPWDPIGATKICALVKTIFVSLMMAL